MANGYDYLGVVHSHREQYRDLPYDVERARRGRPGLMWIAGVVVLIALLVLVFGLLPR